MSSLDINSKMFWPTPMATIIPKVLLNYSDPLAEYDLMDSNINNRGDSEKILAMAILGLGSFLSGMLPAVISERNRRRFPLTTSLLLCFGAGILLATALVHILPEVRQQMKSNYAEIALCGGFFIIYFIDEFIHYFFGEAIQHTNRNGPTSQNRISYSTRRDYGSAERAPLLQDLQHSNGHTHTHIHDSHNGDSAGLNSNAHADVGHSHQPTHCDHTVAEANARICHTSHTEPCAQSMTGTLGLFVAMSLHSAIEGMAIGVQNSAAKVLFLLGAVSCHKFVMGFCLGLEFRSNPQTTLRSQVIGILIFAFGAVLGIGVGMILVDIPSNWMISTLPVIQAFAGGTLFYVTVCEVIPREKARWHQNQARRSAGITQFFAVSCGFAVMCLINAYIRDD